MIYDMKQNDLDECVNIPAFLKAVGVYVLILLVVMLVVTIIVKRDVRKSTPPPDSTIIESENIADKEEMRWQQLIQAIITVESEGNPLAVGKANDVGVLQITPIYVQDVNRIIDTPKYTLDMRTSVDYSLEMFEIYQGHYNPDKDILTAIKIHNPGAGKWYIDKVMNQLNRITEIQS